MEQMSYTVALTKNPTIVISSWMPAREDWTAAIRATESVRAFIMIGDEEQCGTSASWQSDEVFQRFDIPVEGNLRFGTYFISDGGKSKISLFERRK